MTPIRNRNTTYDHMSYYENIPTPKHQKSIYHHKFQPINFAPKLETLDTKSSTFKIKKKPKCK